MRFVGPAPRRFGGVRSVLFVFALRTAIACTVRFSAPRGAPRPLTCDSGTGKLGRTGCGRPAAARVGSLRAPRSRNFCGDCSVGILWLPAWAACGRLARGIRSGDSPRGFRGRTAVPRPCRSCSLGGGARPAPSHSCHVLQSPPDRVSVNENTPSYLASSP